LLCFLVELNGHVGNQTNENMMITVETTINAPVSKVWEHWTKSEHITNWNFATDEWHCPTATDNLESGGEFNWRMEAKDGSMGFDFTGVYDQIDENELITYKMADGRRVEIRFTEIDGEVKLTESFEAEGTNSDEMQRAGWQSILENFKKYVESKEQ
jgi:uncharacterized protein YndB with AHSA1/START domain